MVFAPTPRFHLDKELEPGMIIAINSNCVPLPQALREHFIQLSGVEGSILYEGRNEYSCWRFTSEESVDYHPLEQYLITFKEERGETLCSLQGERDIDDWIIWYIDMLHLRATCVKRLNEFPSDEQRRAIYRAANRHPEASWWQLFTDHKQDFLKEIAEEQEREDLFHDMALMKIDS